MLNPPMQPRRRLPLLAPVAGLAAIGLLLSLVLSGCAGPQARQANAGKGLKPSVQLAPVNLTDKAGPSPTLDGPGAERQVALEAARKLGAVTVAMTGSGGGKLATKADFLFAVPSTDTARVQEAHIVAGHVLCEILELEWMHTPAKAESQTAR